MATTETNVVPDSTNTAPANTLPSPPFVPVEGIANFRDLGHWPIPPTVRTSETGQALRTRPRFIFRCAQPSQITEEGVGVVNSLGITTFYDLRAGPELITLAKLTPVNEIPGTQRVFAPVYKDEDYSPERLAIKYKMYVHKGGPEGFVRAYRDILHHGPNSYRQIFTHIRDRPDEGLVIHCTAGKDRTGVVVALILRIAGVADPHIAKEYNLTEFGMGAWRDAIVAKLVADPRMDGDREAVERMVSAREDNMLAVLQMLDEEFGGAEGYLKDRLGFNDEDIEIIRTNITEPGMGEIELSKI